MLVQCSSDIDLLSKYDVIDTSGLSKQRGPGTNIITERKRPTKAFWHKTANLLNYIQFTKAVLKQVN